MNPIKKTLLIAGIGLALWTLLVCLCAHGQQSTVQVTPGNLTNYAPRAMSPPGGGDPVLGMQTAGAANFVGELGLSWPGSKQMSMWIAGNAGSGGMSDWDVANINFLQGINYIGHPYLMPNIASKLNIEFNGNPTLASYASSPNASCVFIYNWSPYADFNGICTPMVTTNQSFGTTYLTNSDGAKIQLRDGFGLQLGSIPYEQKQKETNQAGSFVIISQAQIPFFFSVNQQVNADADGSGQSQHAWMYFDPTQWKAAWPVQQAHVWNCATNSTNIDALMVQEMTNYVFISSNLFIGGNLRATNPVGFHILGGANLADLSTPQIGVYVNTNIAFNIAQPGSISWDSALLFRNGMVFQAGQYPKFTHALGSPWTVARSDKSSIHDTAATLTSELLIDSSGDFHSLGPSNYVASATRVDGTLSYLRRTANKTSNAYTVLSTESGTWFNNSGNAAASTNTLPAATVGLHYGLDVEAAQNWAFKANGTDTIRNAATVSAAGGLLFASAIGNTVHISCHVAGKWVVDSLTGTWTAQ